MEFIQDVLAAIGVVLNGIPQGLLALSYGFASVPTALGFALGAVSCGVLGSVAPISFQAETIVMAGSMGKNRRDRLSMILFGGLIMVVLGLTGALSAITDFAGDAIVHAMMAGVGFVLVKTAFGMVKENQLVGWISVASAVIIYLVTKYLDPANALVYTIVGSLIISSVAAKIAGQKLGDNVMSEKMCVLKLEKPTVNLSVVRGALSLACLTIGANIAFGNITSGMGGGNLNVDHLTVYSGAADAVSALFGGGPVESIISATGAAPHAVISGVIMMGIMALILFFGLLPKIGKFVPSQSIAGFLFILGAFVTIPGDGAAAFATAEAGGSILAAVTMSVTAVFDPFFGMLAGIVLKLIIGFTGLVL
ncbi:MAG: NCS2 family permease [Christensenellales bacterium]